MCGFPKTGHDYYYFLFALVFCHRDHIPTCTLVRISKHFGMSLTYLSIVTDIACYMYIILCCHRNQTHY